MTVEEMLSPIAARLQSVLDGINTALRGKGQTDAATLSDVETKISSIPSGSEIITVAATGIVISDSLCVLNYDSYPSTDWEIIGFSMYRSNPDIYTNRIIAAMSWISGWNAAQIGYVSSYSVNSGFMNISVEDYEIQLTSTINALFSTGTTFDNCRVMLKHK